MLCESGENDFAHIHSYIRKRFMGTLRFGYFFAALWYWARCGFDLIVVNNKNVLMRFGVVQQPYFSQGRHGNENIPRRFRCI